MTTSSERAARLGTAAAFAALLLLQPAHGSAQQVVQDARGRDLVLDYFNINPANAVRPIRSVITLNSAAEAVKARLLIPGGSSDVQHFHSFDAQLQAADGVAEIFSGREITGVQTLSYRYGRSHTPLTHGSGAIDFLVLGLDYSTASFRLFDPSRAVGDQISSRDFKGPEVSANYSVLYRGRFRPALDVRYRRNHNASSLAPVEVEIRTVQTAGGPGGETQTVVARKVSARRGPYEEWSSVPVGASLTFIPSEVKADTARLKPGFSAYGYTELARGRGSPITAGANLTLTRQERDSGIRRTLGGVFGEVSDVFDVAHSRGRLIDNLRVGIFLNVKMIDLSRSPPPPAAAAQASTPRAVAPPTAPPAPPRQTSPP